MLKKKSISTKIILKKIVFNDLKVLYFSYRYDPSQPESGSSVDYEFYNQIKNIASDVVVFNPKLTNGIFYQIIKKTYKKIFCRKLLKFGLINSYKVSRQLKEIIDQESFYVIFTIFPNPLCFFKSNIPLFINLTLHLLVNNLNGK